MSIEAFWTVTFASNLLNGGFGTTVFDTQNIYGGDGTMYYRGRYKIENNSVSAVVKVTQFAPGESVFGPNLKKFTLVSDGYEGDFNSNQFTLLAHVQESPNLRIAIRFDRLENLN